MLRKDFLKRMRARAKAWTEKRYVPAAERMGERKPLFETNAGLGVAPLYTPADLADQDYFESIGLPGEYPFTRGTYPIGYRSRYWQQNVYAGFGTGPDTNERLKFALSQGETALNLIMDVPTSYWGIDADDPLAEGEVGRTGVSMNSIEDMADAFADIPIDRISVTLNTTSVVLPAIYFAMAEERGIAVADLKGTCRNNPLVDYVSCNSGVMPAPDDALRELADFVAFTLDHAPKWNPFNIGSYEYRENGATAVQELGFLFGNAIAYTDALIARGLQFDDFAPKYLFYTSVQTNLFEEIVKYRAARRIWAKIAKERYGARNPASLLFRIHVQTSGLTLTAEEPLNNIARATIQGLAAVLGGTNSLYTDPYDEALCLPSEQGLRTAMRTQQIIMEESGVADTIDPLGGSYYVESLTDAMEEGANGVLAEIEAQGGMVKAIENGWV
ncbi:MAG: methylmalonyl-CoA mutase family protein, partial [Alphaproteobacteria bacterium]|nr:methylmalonyl-CoA mutase family protein [Alphaproteobacteria bacterium]